MKQLSERRAADRKQMAGLLVALLEREGVEYERHDNTAPFWTHAIRIELKVGALQLMVEFDGKSVQPDVHVLTWGVSLHSSACLSDKLGSVNTYHFQKATAIALGFESLMQIVERGIKAAQDGSAFSPEREAEYRRKTENGEHLWQRIAKAQAEGTMGALLS